MDILLGTGLTLTSKNDIALTTSYPQSVSQRLTIRFKTFVNEWMLDLNYGVDWFNKILGKGRSKSAIDAIIRNIITQEAEVQSIASFSSTLIGRAYSCKFAVIPVSLNKVVTLKILLDQNGFKILNENGEALLVNA